MGSPPPLPYDPLETLRTDGVAFIDIVAGSDLATSVPTCPGWTLGDLAQHQGECWHFWGRVVADRITDPTRLEAIRQIEPVAHDLLVDWLALTHNELYSALVDAGIELPVWNWTGEAQTTEWLRRRMVHEASVHRFDAAHATGDVYEVPTVVAADGIDEFLMWFAGSDRADGVADVAGTVHLHCTDTDDGDVAGGEWYIASLDETGCDFTREHRKGDAAVRGRAHDLLMWLWGRSESGVEVIGDEDVAQRFRAFSDLS